MNGQSYLLLSATNHFVGSTNATIVSPISDFYLASTNGMMAISNLTTPFVPRICGEIEVWSGRWTNVTPTGILTYYNVTMVDSRLDPQQPSQIQNLSLRSTNLLIGDALNVFGSLLLDTVRLTISTNDLHAPTPNGELNLTSGDLTWSASLPKLAYLTNYGKISSANSIFFGGARTPPWFSGTYDEPYQSFVTHGLLIAQGDTIWANYFEASGTNNSGVGPIGVQAGSAIVTNGVFQATDADITLTCGSLLISNQVLRAGRSITLTVTNYLDDGSVSNSVDAINGSVSDGRMSNRVEVVTNQNNWTVGGGINLLRLPPKASLLATTVTNNAFANAEVDNTWAGKDYGCWPSGFVNNAALGRLILDGQDSGSLFAFWRTDLTNALYVDLLELKDATVNADIFGNLVGVYLQTNFTIYYGDAVWNGLSIAEQINGRYGVSGTNGGRFCWVSNYNTGFFSSTNVMYSDHSVHRLNRALVTSCWIDSNGNGTPNCVDPDPVPIPASITTQPQGQNVNQYSNAVFTVVATGSPPPTYQWRFNGAPISGATGSSYTRTNVQPSDAGSYLVVVSNSTATVTSTNAILTVTPVLKAPVLKVVVTDPPPRSAPRSLVLSWSTIPGASNYLYAASSLPTTNWQLVTNFLSPTNAWEATATDQVKTNGGRYYRVRVLSP
jgi:hypothetical protein